MRTETADLDLLRLRTRSRSESVGSSGAISVESVDNRSRWMEAALLGQRIEVEGRIVGIRLVSSSPLILVSAVDGRLAGRCPSGRVRSVSAFPIRSLDVAVGHGRRWSDGRRRLRCRTVAGRRVVGIAVVGRTSRSPFALLTRNLLE